MSTQDFTCNLCGSVTEAIWEKLFREGPSCGTCGSSVRMREIVCAVNEIQHLFDASKLKIIGLSDAELVSDFFSQKFGNCYLNTYFDSEPKLDIGNLSKRSFASADLLISSDVYEHVFFPLHNSILGSFNLLKPGGHLVLTMPWNTWQDSVEHYPWMVSYSVHQDSEGIYSVIGIDQSGSERIVANPVFHGGPGNTLEMRKININVLVHELEQVGFIEVTIHDQNRPEFGIRRADGVVGVVTARRPHVIDKELFQSKWLKSIQRMRLKSKTGK